MVSEEELGRVIDKVFHPIIAAGMRYEMRRYRTVNGLKNPEEVRAILELIYPKNKGKGLDNPVFEQITLHFTEKMIELIRLFDKKQKDYGRENIAEFGRMGILIRMNDKMARIKNLTRGGSLLAKVDSKQLSPEVLGNHHNEALRDSYMDIAVYAVIDSLLEDGTW